MAYDEFETTPEEKFAEACASFLIILDSFYLVCKRCAGHEDTVLQIEDRTLKVTCKKCDVSETIRRERKPTW